MVGGVAGFGLDMLLEAQAKEEKKRELSRQIKQAEQKQAFDNMILSRKTRQAEDLQNESMRYQREDRAEGKEMNKLELMRNAIMRSREARTASRDSWIQRGY